MYRNAHVKISEQLQFWFSRLELRRSTRPKCFFNQVSNSVGGLPMRNKFYHAPSKLLFTPSLYSKLSLQITLVFERTPNERGSILWVGFLVEDSHQFLTAIGDSEHWVPQNYTDMGYVNSGITVIFENG